MKIEVEDIEYTLGEDDFLIPFGILTDCGEKTVTCLRGFEHDLSLFGNFDESLKTVEDYFRFIGDKCGYVTEIAETLIFSADSNLKINPGLIQDTSEVIMPGNTYENLLDSEPDSLGQGELYIGTVLEGKIVSAAWENPHDPQSDVIDIAVETAFEYEKKGYGTSNVAKLCRFLLDPGKRVTYIAEKNNFSSVKIAEKICLSESGKEYRIIWYK